MNRLKGLASYLSGPIDFADDNGTTWRNMLTPFLEDKNCRVFNPLKHTFWGTQDLDSAKRPRMDKLLQEGKYEELREEMKVLAHWDLRCVDLSSLIIVNYDINIFTCGTHDEMFLGNRSAKPVLLKIPEGTRKKLPKWIYGRFPPEHLFETWDALKDYLTAIDSDPNYAFTKGDKKRWLFFDGEFMS